MEPAIAQTVAPRVGFIRFPPYEVDRQTGELTGDGRRIKLQVQPFQVLLALLERPGEVVTREDLRQRLWPGDTFVDFDNSVNIAIRKLRQALRDDATQPRFIETLPKRGYRFIAFVETPALQAIAAPPRRDPWWRRIAAFGALALAALAVASAAYVLLARLGGPVSASIRVRPAVAITAFRNLTGASDRAWVSTAIADMMASELSVPDRLRTVPGDSSPPSRIRKNRSVEYVLTGSYFDSGTSGGRVRVDLRLENTHDSEKFWTVTEWGSESDLPDMVARAGLDLRTRLGIAAAGQSRAEAQAAAPPSADAGHLYYDGLARLRQFDAKGARELLERAVATAPDFAPAHSALSAAWSTLGYSEMARQEAARARDLAAGLPLVERLPIEARFHESVGQWDKAIDIYRRLDKLSPDDPDFDMRCAAAEVKAGKGADALATVALLRAKPAKVRDDAAIDYAESLAANQTGDFPRAQAAAAKAAVEAGNREEWMLVADARLLECREFEALGDMPPAEQSCVQAKDQYARVGDQAGVATATGYLAAALSGAGDRDRAEQSYQRALSIQRSIGNQGGALWDLNGLATVLWAKGDIAGARGNYEEALRTAQEIKSRPDAADARANIGFMWLQEGDLAQARKASAAALTEYRDMANSSGMATALGNLGEALYHQGELAEAARNLDEALSLDRRDGKQGDAADALAWLGQIRLAAGDAAGARALYDESLQAWRKLGESYATPMRVRFAELDLESGRIAQAEAEIRGCLDAVQGLERHRLELAAHTLLARILLAEGKRDQARQELDRAAPMAAASQSRARRLAFAIAAAQAAASAKALERAASEARRYGFLGLQFEAQLAQGEMEIAAGHDARLRRLEKEAQSRGFLTIARAAAHQRLTPR